MKKLLSFILCSAMVLCAAACSGESSSSGSSSKTESKTESNSSESSSEVSSSLPESAAVQTKEESAPDYSSMSEEEIYDLCVERSLMTTGDMTRMANVLKKAGNGEEITVAYIGGSITEGLTAGPELCWAKLSYEWLCEKFPDTKINYVNAGISGTPSILGNLRLQRDVLAYSPDIVFVEFAVNDGQDALHKSAYESLVRTLLSQEKEIAPVLLFTVLKNGYSCQEHMSQIGSNYSLPMISLPNSLGEEFNSGRMAWETYSDDESHPNEYGHTVVRDFVANYFETVINQIDENAGEVNATLPEPVFSEKYMNMKFLDNTSLEVAGLEGFEQFNTHDKFQNGWMYRGNTGASMKFNMECSVLGMVFKANNSALFGDAEIYVDGELVKTVSSNMSDGWNNPVTTYLIDETESAAHEIEIKVKEGENLTFSILGFGVC